METGYTLLDLNRVFFRFGVLTLQNRLHLFPQLSHTLWCGKGY